MITVEPKPNLTCDYAIRVAIVVANRMFMIYEVNEPCPFIVAELQPDGVVINLCGASTFSYALSQLIQSVEPWMR